MVRDPEFMKTFERTVDIGMKLKKAMQKRGIFRARAKCPDCPGKWVEGSINGPRNHLHYSCECGKHRMME